MTNFHTLLTPGTQCPLSPTGRKSRQENEIRQLIANNAFPTPNSGTHHGCSHLDTTVLIGKPIFNSSLWLGEGDRGEENRSQNQEGSESMEVEGRCRPAASTAYCHSQVPGFHPLIPATPCLPHSPALLSTHSRELL